MGLNIGGAFKSVLNLGMGLAKTGLLGPQAAGLAHTASVALNMTGLTTQSSAFDKKLDELNRLAAPTINYSGVGRQ